MIWWKTWPPWHLRTPSWGWRRTSSAGLFWTNGLRFNFVFTLHLFNLLKSAACLCPFIVQKTLQTAGFCFLLSYVQTHRIFNFHKISPSSPLFCPNTRSHPVFPESTHTQEQQRTQHNHASLCVDRAVSAGGWIGRVYGTDSFRWHTSAAAAAAGGVGNYYHTSA